MNSSMTKPKIAALAAILLAATPMPAFAEPGEQPDSVLFKLWGAIKGQGKEIDRKAMETFKAAPRQGSCAQRRERFLALLPDALRFSRYARDINRETDAKIAAAKVKTLDLGGGRTAFYEAAGRHYAEIRVDAERREVIVVFRGTRLKVRTDISTDVLNFVGLKTAYYNWASSLVAQAVREHPGMQVIVAGQSLGGGLAINAVLRNPGVKGFAFNPAGLSLLTWVRTRHAERERVNSAVTVISMRNTDHIEPITAISLAGRSVLPGHIFVLKANASTPVTLHSAGTIVATLEQAGSAPDASICDGDLGVLAD